jgi:hypothetical protein
MQPFGLRSCNERDNTTLNRSGLRIVIGCCRNRKEPSHIAIRRLRLGSKSSAIGNADIKDNTGSFWLVSGKTVSFVSSAGDADFGTLEHFRAAAVMTRSATTFCVRPAIAEGRPCTFRSISGINLVQTRRAAAIGSLTPPPQPLRAGRPTCRGQPAPAAPCSD